jgi:hypothetical protein
MELSPSWKTAERSAAQEFPRILWKPKFYYRVQKDAPPSSIVDQMNPVHTTPSYFSNINLYIIFLPTYTSTPPYVFMA